MTETTNTTIQIITMQGHPPLRTQQEPEELWLGYPIADFGGEYLRGLQLADGRLLLWYRHNSPYTDGKSYSRFVGYVQPATSASGTLEVAQAAYRDLRQLLAGPADEYGCRASFRGQRSVSEVQAWLADLGYSMYAEV